MTEGHQGVKTDNLSTGINPLQIKDIRARLLLQAEVPAMSADSPKNLKLTEDEAPLEVIIFMLEYFYFFPNI